MQRHEAGWQEGGALAGNTFFPWEVKDLRKGDEYWSEEAVLTGCSPANSKEENYEGDG